MSPFPAVVSFSPPTLVLLYIVSSFPSGPTKVRIYEYPPFSATACVSSRLFNTSLDIYHFVEILLLFFISTENVTESPGSICETEAAILFESNELTISLPLNSHEPAVVVFSSANTVPIEPRINNMHDNNAINFFILSSFTLS